MSFTMLLCGENSGVGGERKKNKSGTLDKLMVKCCICKIKTLFHESDSFSGNSSIFFPAKRVLFIYWTIFQTTVIILTRSAIISFSRLPHKAWLCSVHLIFECVVQTHLLDNILNLLWLENSTFDSIWLARWKSLVDHRGVTFHRVSQVTGQPSFLQDILKLISFLWCELFLLGTYKWRMRHCLELFGDLLGYSTKIMICNIVQRLGFLFSFQ